MTDFTLTNFYPFQHTAAWRRLPDATLTASQKLEVSTHSRVEAAA